MSSSDFEPRPIDTHKPSSARIYHHMITGEVIFESDLPFIHRLYEEIPFYPVWARHNRQFLTRAVRYMVDAGIRQFLDIGSGLPTGGNTHEVARELAPETRVVYVDNDEEAINRARDLLLSQGVRDSATMLDADLRDPARILEHPDTRQLIDVSEPVGLLLVSVLPWVPDNDKPAALIAHLREALAPGSHIAMTHVSLQDAGPQIKQQVAAGAAIFRDASPLPCATAASSKRSSTAGRSSNPASPTPPTGTPTPRSTPPTPHAPAISPPSPDCPDLKPPPPEDSSKGTSMSSTPTARQFRKAAASSPQQACVMIYRDEHRTLVWDDKLADTADATVPLEQCLVFDHAQFEAVEHALRTGTLVPPWLTIVHRAGGIHEFSATPRYVSSVGAATLSFDDLEYAAFVQAVRNHEFDRAVFLSQAS